MENILDPPVCRQQKVLLCTRVIQRIVLVDEFPIFHLFPFVDFCVSQHWILRRETVIKWENIVIHHCFVCFYMASCLSTTTSVPICGWLWTRLQTNSEKSPWLPTRVRETKEDRRVRKYGVVFRQQQQQKQHTRKTNRKVVVASWWNTTAWSSTLPVMENYDVWR